MPDESLRVPGFCPHCGMLMRGSKCTNTYYDFKCCHHCFIQFVEDREQRWRDGWRPTAEEVKAFVDNITSSVIPSS